MELSKRSTPSGRSDHRPYTKDAVDYWLKRWNRTEPLTREDLDRLKEVNDGTARSLDLSDRNLQGIDLAAELRNGAMVGYDLRGAQLVRANLEEAKLSFADLREAVLTQANLRGANLYASDLRDASALSCDLRNARLDHARLEGCDLRGEVDMRGSSLRWIHLSDRTDLEEVRWDSRFVSFIERQRTLPDAIASYRILRMWHQQHGLYWHAGEFHFREMVCRRKLAFVRFWIDVDAASWKGFIDSIWRLRPRWHLLKDFLVSLRALEWDQLKIASGHLFYEQLMGYGERPWRVAGSGLLIVFGLTAAYYFAGAFKRPITIWDALYFSAVSFSSLGYGPAAPEPVGWAQYAGSLESFLGVFLAALFVVTFMRNLNR